MKIRTLSDLNRTLEKNIKVYNDFRFIYGSHITDEQKMKYRAISSIHSELPFITRFEDILNNLINGELYEDWRDKQVYHYMVRWLDG